MGHIGIDVHKMESQICILTEAGELIGRRVRTEPRRYISLIRALHRQHGYRVPSGSAEGFLR